MVCVGPLVRVSGNPSGNTLGLLDQFRHWSGTTRPSVRIVDLCPCLAAVEP